VSPGEDVEALQRHLNELANTRDDELTERYFLRWPRRPPGLYWQFRWLVALILRSLESLRIWRPDPWPVALKHAHTDHNAKPLLIWGLGADRDTLRRGCDGFSRQQDALSGFAPVLVTDVADFAFFSRLGWLVEYLPRLAGEGEPYEERKLKFLARLYRGAPILPVSAGCQGDAIRRWLDGDLAPTLK
jgi:hypothetical protein